MRGPFLDRGESRGRHCAGMVAHRLAPWAAGLLVCALIGLVAGDRGLELRWSRFEDADSEARAEAILEEANEPRALQVRALGEGFPVDANGKFRYPRLAEARDRLRSWAETMPHVVEVLSAQERYGLPPQAPCPPNDDCTHYMARITHFPSWVANPDRPQVFLSGNLHGDEAVGPVAVLALVELLLGNYRNAEAWESQRGEEASAPPTFNPWLKRLVDTRVLVILPFSNPQGYSNREREEVLPDGRPVDPNRDFPFNQHDTQRCMQTVTARVVNEIFREHLLQVAITFHGGTESITYEWGSSAYTSSGSEAPDDASQASLAVAMSRFGGLFARVGNRAPRRYPTGRMNPVVYPVDGGMEDWSYAASWDQSRVIPCEPHTLGGYARDRTVYNDAQLRCSTFLVETSDDKRPVESELGRWDQNLLRPQTDPSSADSARFGHVPRNLRLALVILDAVEPYTQVTHVAVSMNDVRSRASALRRGLAASSVRSPLSLQRPVRVRLGSSFDAISPYREQYHQWVTVTDQAEPDGPPLSLRVDVAWDVGGAFTVDETGVMVFRWPSRVAPSRFYELLGLGGPISRQSRQSMSEGGAPRNRSSGLLGNAEDDVNDDAAVVAAIVAAVRGERPLPDDMNMPVDAGTCPGTTRVEKLPLEGWGLPPSSAPASAVRVGVTRVVVPMAGQGSSMPARWTDSAVLDSDLQQTPYVSRFQASVTVAVEQVVPLVACQSPEGRIARCEDSWMGEDGSPTTAPAEETLVVIPYARTDHAWTSQNRPIPEGTAPQTHVVNVRTKPGWLGSNSAFVARGRTFFAGAAVFVGVTDWTASSVSQLEDAIASAWGAVPAPIPSPTPSTVPTQPSITPSPHPTASVTPGAKASPLPSGGGSPVCVGAHCDTSPEVPAPQAGATVPFFGATADAAAVAVYAQVLTILVGLAVCVCTCRSQIASCLRAGGGLAMSIAARLSANPAPSGRAGYEQVGVPAGAGQDSDSDQGVLGAMENAVIAAMGSGSEIAGVHDEGDIEDEDTIHEHEDEAEDEKENDDSAAQGDRTQAETAAHP